MATLYDVFNIMNCITFAYVGHVDCRGAHFPVGREETWDTAGTVQASAVRGRGMNLLELVFLRR